jgi:hypothetical protein
MSDRLRHMTLAGCAFALLSGCALHRANVTALSKEQAQYYAKLRDTLTTNRQLFATGLEEQLKVDLVRQQNLQNWRLDLEKAGVLLQRAPNATGAQKLLYMELSEVDLNDVHTLAAREQIEASRKQTILNLYDKVMESVGVLEKNNTVMVEYLGSKDTAFALRSLDVEGISRAIAGVRGVQEELGQIEKRSEEEKRKESERTQQVIGQVRNILLRVFEK